MSNIKTMLLQFFVSLLGISAYAVFTTMLSYDPILASTKVGGGLASLGAVVFVSMIFWISLRAYFKVRFSLWRSIIECSLMMISVGVVTTSPETVILGPFVSLCILSMGACYAIHGAWKRASFVAGSFVGTLGALAALWILKDGHYLMTAASALALICVIGYMLQETVDWLRFRVDALEHERSIRTRSSQGHFFHGGRGR